ncbi:MAG: hypothetical protein KAU50_03010 [Candidatus Marinimicrobia bacterium]|nr:hypothetical protein [Candidatus Neomarinimicrobiota bacterium]
MIPDSSQSERRPSPSKDSGPSISLLDLSVLLARKSRFIGKMTGIITLVALIVAISLSSTYTATVSVIRESVSSVDGGMNRGLAALRGLGINLGGEQMGLTVDAFPAVLMSREVLLVTVRQSFYIRDLDTTITLTEYLARKPGLGKLILGTVKKYTIGLPRTIMKKSREKKHRYIQTKSSRGYPTFHEEKAIKLFGDMLNVSIDRISGIMHIQVTAKDPQLAADIAQAIMYNLRQRIRTLHAEKAEENLFFIQSRFRQAQVDLDAADRELARFLDQNLSPTTAKLKAVMEQLQRQVNFKVQLYSELQAQLASAEIEMERSKPVLTVLDTAVPPVEPTGPGRTIIVLGGLFFGLFLSLGISISQNIINSQPMDSDAQAKINEIREAFRFNVSFRRRKGT